MSSNPVLLKGQCAGESPGDLAGMQTVQVISTWNSSSKCCPETQSYCLYMKCLPKVHGLNTWSPAGGAILGCSGNFQRWNQLEEVGHWEQIFEGVLSLIPSSLSHSLSFSFPVCYEVETSSLPHVLTAMMLCSRA
jgi:hypothetical protein